MGYGLKHTALISSSIGNQSILVVDIFDDDILTAICKHHAQLSSYGLSASVDAGALQTSISGPNVWITSAMAA